MNTSSLNTVRYTARAPGSLMLFGEHSVLYGGQAIVAAVNQHIYAHLVPRDDHQITIHSDRLGLHRTTQQALTIVKPFEYVLTVISQLLPELPCGFDLTIEAEFSDNLGLGSSAAVTVAVFRVLADWLKLNWTHEELYWQAKTVILTVQGMGSGADVAASILETTIAYRAEPLEMSALPTLPDLALVYCGYKTPTPQVIQHVSQKQAKYPRIYPQIYATMNHCTEEAVIAYRQQHWSNVGELMNIYQGLQESLGVSTAQINALLSDLRAEANILGAKISGSGLGDCICGVGSLNANRFPKNDTQQRAGVRQLTVKIK